MNIIKSIWSIYKLYRFLKCNMLGISRITVKHLKMQSRRYFTNPTEYDISILLQSANAPSILALTILINNFQVTKGSTSYQGKVLFADNNNYHQRITTCDKRCWRVGVATFHHQHYSKFSTIQQRLQLLNYIGIL